MIKTKLILTFIVLTLAAVVLFGQSAGNRGYIVEIGDSCPDFSMTLANGKTVTLATLKDKIFMLQFTASWCSVCRKEMPHIEREIWQQYKDQGLVVIGVDRDEPLAVVQKFAQEMKISYPLALDPGAEIFKKFAFENSGVTRNVLVNRDGKIVHLTRLYDKAEFHELVNHIGELFQ